MLSGTPLTQRKAKQCCAVLRLVAPAAGPFPCWAGALALEGALITIPPRHLSDGKKQALKAAKSCEQDAASDMQLRMQGLERRTANAERLVASVRISGGEPLNKTCVSVCVGEGGSIAKERLAANAQQNEKSLSRMACLFHTDAQEDQCDVRVCCHCSSAIAGLKMHLSCEAVYTTTPTIQLCCDAACTTAPCEAANASICMLHDARLHMWLQA